MEVYSMVGLSKSSFAEKCKRLFEDDIRMNGAKYIIKLKKKESKQKCQKRTYHLQDKYDVMMVGL